MLPEFPPYGSPEWLEQMQGLLVVGMALCGVLLIVINEPGKRKKKVAPKVQSPTCKLHQRPENLCRDMHGTEDES